MIMRHRVAVQSRTATIGAEGEHEFTYTSFKTGYACDIQPIAASPEELRAWGIVDLSANAKAMYYPRDDSITTLMRVVDGNDIYEIRNINRWSIHDKALIVPVQG